MQEIADYVGDSLGLSRQAAATDAAVIVFCGVHFMAETAAILSPEKTVLMPDAHAGCPMANMATVRQLAAWKAEHPEAVVVTYVNSSAAVKALSDICCTSANAVAVVESVERGREILFVPDRNLGHYVAKETGRELILWNGYCPTHERMLPELIAAQKAKHPAARVAMHPECRPEALALADYVGSTTGILRWCRESDGEKFLIGTEVGLLHRLRRENPEKTFHPATPVGDCPNMKLASVEKIAWCLEEMAPTVSVPAEIAEKARRPIEKMLEVAA